MGQTFPHISIRDAGLRGIGTRYRSFKISFFRREGCRWKDQPSSARKSLKTLGLLWCRPLAPPARPPICHDCHDSPRHGHYEPIGSQFGFIRYGFLTHSEKNYEIPSIIDFYKCPQQSRMASGAPKFHEYRNSTNQLIPWESMGLHGYLLKFIDRHGHSWALMDMRVYP